VMTRHEVDALLRLALLVGIERRAADQAIGKALERALLAAEKAARVIAKPPVPLPPAISHEAPHLVQAGRVPRLGDELRPRQRWVRLDIPKHGRACHDRTRLVALEDSG